MAPALLRARRTRPGHPDLRLCACLRRHDEDALGQGHPQRAGAAAFAGSIQIADFTFPSYRLLLIAIGVALFVATWLAIERTRIGALIRASVADREMVGGLGFDVRLLFTAVFAFGTGLAGLAGCSARRSPAIYPGLDFEVLITTLIVVVVGGLGSITGAFWASLLIGVAETFGKALLPEIASFIIFGVMAAVLLVRSWGQDEEEVE